MITTNSLRKLRLLMLSLKRLYYVKVFGMDIHPTATFSLTARFDKTNPKGVHIGRGSYVAFEALIMTHDMVRGLRAHTWVGEKCFIGARSILLPGVRIGDQCIVAAGSVVTKDVPAHCIVAGNPAQVIRQGIETIRAGCLKDAWQFTNDPYGFFSELV